MQHLVAASAPSFSQNCEGGVMRARTPVNLHAHARFSGIGCPFPLTRSAVAEEVSGQLGGHDALQPLQQVHLLRKDAAGPATWFMRAAASGRLHAPALEWPPTLLTKSCKAWLQGAQSAAHETHHGLAGGQQVLLCHDDLAGLGGQERDTNSALRNSWQTAASWSSASACFGHALPSRWGCWAGECTMAAIHTNGPG